MNSRTKKIGPVGIALAVMALSVPSYANILEITGSGDVIFNNGYTGSLTGSTFTFEILIDLNEPLGTSGGTNLSSWLNAVQSFTIDSENFSGLSSGLTSFQRLGTYDNQIMVMKDSTSSGAEFQGQLPLNYFGNGPYAMTDITGISLSDYIFTAKVRAEDTVAGVFGLGEVTAISYRIIPEPTSAGIILSLMAFYSLAQRRGR